MADLTLTRLRSLLRYNSESGEFTWLKRVNSRSPAGSRAGGVSRGYVSIRVDGVKHRANRLAWFYTHGIWPKCEVDHINRNPSDNRLVNLRLADRRENARNQAVRKRTKSGVLGVGWFTPTGKWRARIKVDGVETTLGYFDDKAVAVAVRVAAERRLFGCFAPRRGAR